MPISAFPRGSIHGRVVLSDATPATPLSITVQYTMGDVQIAGLAANLNEVVPVTDGRGKLIGVIHGDRTFPTFSFSAKITSLTGAAAPGSLADWVLRRAAYSAAISTTGAGTPWVFKTTIEIEGTNMGDAADGSIVLADCHCTIDFAEAKDGNTFTLAGTVYGAITGDLACAQIT